MNDEFRQMVIEALRRGENLPAEWARELFPPEKREYELTYYGKAREEDIIADTMAVPLQPASTFGSGSLLPFSEESKNGDWHNKLIFGDNLQALKSLLALKEQGTLCNADGTPGVRLIYIDPPFATKKEFRGSQDQKAYQDKIAGAGFVEFVRKRLILMRQLLANNGSLFLHTDYHKAHYLKVVLDEVFGESCFRNEIMLPGRASKNLQQQFDQISRLNVRHDVIFWYAASTETRFDPLWIAKHDSGNPEGHWHHFWSNADRPTMRYKLFGIVPATGQWTWEEKRALKANENYTRFENESGGRTLAEYWRDTGCALDFIRKGPDDGKPQYWRAPTLVRMADTVWSGVPVYSSGLGYPTEKNEALLKQVIDLASEQGDLVLDAFAGSGTTLAVAEKLGRRWIGIDCGKLAIYTIQKRLLNLKREIGNKGKPLTPKPFTVFNAGLYDFSTLRQLPWEGWRFFALQLFGCKPDEHTIGGLKLDGKLKGASVMVFDHHKNAGKRVDEDTVKEIHAAVGDKIGRKFFIIAPRGVFDFQQDYLEFGDVKYYALRIPYSVINELHLRDFSALRQPNDEADVNEIVEAWGFDFIQPPELKWTAKLKKRKGQLLEDVCIKINAFESRARIRGQDKLGGFETLSMVMVDYDYNGSVFDLDAATYAHQLQADEYQMWLPAASLGESVMVVFLDIYGNESRVLIPRADLGLTKKSGVQRPIKKAVK